jgi:two-component system response regulator AtoC
MMFRLLIIDDEANMRHMLKALLSKSGYEVDLAENGMDALEKVQAGAFDFILCDIRMPVMDGLQFLSEAKEHLDKSTVIMMSAYGTVDLALEAMKKGAYDFISKPFKSDEVLLALKKAEERETLKQENRKLKSALKEIKGRESFSPLVSSCERMRNVLKLARQVARHDTSVLITGESGTGKELVAKGIHGASLRADQNLVAVNCGSIPQSLLESEFFGYAKGAFTGADKEKKGLFEAAEGGTLFLDEIGELPLELQVKLLRVLQEREIRPVGSNITRKIDVRILAATSKNLDEEVKAGTFRQDLLFRLNVVEISLPPLRAREGDIPLLANHFISKFRQTMGVQVLGIQKPALMMLSNYGWPGNVRELENAIEHSMIYAEGKLIGVEDLPDSIRSHRYENTVDSVFQTFSIREGKEMLEKFLIQKALSNTNGNKSQAAILLEVSYPSLLSKIKEYGLDVKKNNNIC